MNPPPAPGLALRIVLPFAFGFMLAETFRVANAVVGPRLAHEFALGPERLGLLTSVYFVVFALMQLPAGVLLDRFGPRRVCAGLMGFAALGCLLFAAGAGFAGLTAGRALIAFGVVVNLMAGLQAFVLWFPAGAVARISSLMWAAGALGGMLATVPMEIAVEAVGWRWVFVGLGAGTVAAALCIARFVPDRGPAGAGRPAGGSYRDIARAPLFKALFPVTLATQGVFTAVPALWAGPWLRDVIGLAPVDVATHLFLFPLGLLVGFVSLGLVVGRGPFTPERVADGGVFLFLVAQAAMLADGLGHPMIVAFAFGLFATTGTLYYPELAKSVAPHLAGRANTALNLVVFIGAFMAQYGTGAVLGLWPSEGGRYAPEGYRWAFGGTLAVEILTFAWLVRCRLHMRRGT